jgi:hypothetical protein
MNRSTHAEEMAMTRTFRRIRLAAGVLLLIVFATYQRDSSRDGATSHDETRVGAWFSPWLVRVVAGSGDAAPSETLTIRALSWSWPCLAAGAALLWSCRRRPTAPAG